MAKKATKGAKKRAAKRELIDTGILRFVSRLAAVGRSLLLRKGKKRATSQERLPTPRSCNGEGQSHSICLTTKPTAIAVSVCRLSALTNVRPGIDTRAANSCAEAT